jgi:glycosyltransferase involved in cell wall biosynthesis
MNIKSVAIIGTVGLPANYGGFETLADNLVKYHKLNNIKAELIIYCSSKRYSIKLKEYQNAKLKYIPISPNGYSSVFYDVLSIISAVINKYDVILLLGVSGAIILPLVRLLSSVRVITNIDGIEWKRNKWRGAARLFLRVSEMVAIYFSHEVLADNVGIKKYVQQRYGVNCKVIAYGGDHAISVQNDLINEYLIPKSFALCICRIEPENNLHIILEAFSRMDKEPLVIIGNWNNSSYGIQLREKYIIFDNIYLFDPVYELGKLKTFRERSTVYIHGHSAGGTNPSLVEAMHFGKAVLAFDCIYNRYTTKDSALYFKTADCLVNAINILDRNETGKIGLRMLEIAQEYYVWNIIAKNYFDTLIS